MTSKLLKRLVRVDVREYWKGEASNFTPWLADEENLEILSDALGMQLELIGTEKSVGPFRADIVCKDGYNESEDLVLIENQLEQTDHAHLGQLLTYASGLHAVTIIWVARQFREEHQSALDWLNTKTDDSVRFFGLEIELWRIENSPAAPKFNIISQPNQWSRSVARADYILDNGELSDTQQMRLEYWKAFNEFLDTQKGGITGRKAKPYGSMRYSIGHSACTLRVSILKQKRKIRCCFYIRGNDALKLWFLLHEQKEKIERELGTSLEWEDTPQNSPVESIAIYYNDVDFLNRTNWPEQHEWLAKNLSAMYRTFAKRITDPDFAKRVKDLAD